MTQHEQEPAGRPVDQRGISRRDVMRRGALVGGAMVWATPMVQTMARPAFAAEGTPVNMSWAAFAFTLDGQDYGFKVDVDGPDLEGPGSTPCCKEPTNWNGGDVTNALDHFQFTVEKDRNCLFVTGFPAAVGTVHYAAMNAGGDTDSAHFDGTGHPGCGQSNSEDTLCAKGDLVPDADGRVRICDDQNTG